MKRLLILFLMLSACSHQKVARIDAKQESAPVLSLLGSEIQLNLGRGVFREKSLSIADWKVDQAFEENWLGQLKDHGIIGQRFVVDSAALQKAQDARESRYKRIVGKRNQALMELLFTSAEKQGLKYFLLALPIEEQEKFPTHRGPIGVACNGEKVSRAYAYFSFEFALWNVEKRKIEVREVVNQDVSESITFGDCATVAAHPELAKALEDPVKKILELIAKALFDKMSPALYKQ